MFKRIKEDIAFLLAVLAIGTAIILAGTRYVAADTGHEGATRKEVGSYGSTRVVTVSSTTGTAIFQASIKRPDGVCRFFNTVWIGTTSATQHNQTHDNISIGFPVYSTETFKLDGSFTGTFYGTADSGLSSVQGRCIEGLVQ